MVNFALMKIYAISGLGADDRVFYHLRKLIDLEFIAWKKNKANETLQEYAIRMATDIDATKPFALLGLSFGGVVAQEICQFLKPEKLILLSSLRHQDELQILIKIIKATHVVEHIPLPFFKPPIALCRYYFSTNDTKMLKELIDAIDLELVKWSIIQLLAWQAKPLAIVPIRIHGTADRLLYYQDDAYPVECGGHFMVYDKAPEVADIMHKFL